MGKSYESYSISDINRLNLSFLKKDRTPDEIATMSENISYLTSMSASMNNQGLLSKSFLEVFDRDTFHTLSKIDMNKALHELAQEYTQNQQALSNMPYQMNILDECIADGLFADRSKEELIQDISHMEVTRDNAIDASEDLYSRFAQKVRHVAQYNQDIDEMHVRLECLDENSINHVLVNSIKEVIAGGVWQYAGKKEDFRIVTGRASRNGVMRSGYTNMKGHLFITTNDVICQYYNPAAGVNQEVNFGRLGVTLSDKGEIKHVRFLFNFMANTGVQHPHLSNNSVCWGNGVGRYSDLVADAKPNMNEILTLFMSLMETYCPDQPYESLNTFHKRRKHRIADAVAIEDIEQWPRELLNDELKGKYDMLKAENDMLVEYFEAGEGEDYSDISKMCESNVFLYQDQYRSWQMARTSDSDPLPDVLSALLLSKESCERIIGVPFSKVWNNSIGSGVRRSYLVHSMQYHDLLSGNMFVDTNNKLRRGIDGLYYNDRDINYTTIATEESNSSARYVAGIIRGVSNESID